MRKNAKNCCFLNDFFTYLYTEIPYLCTRIQKGLVYLR